MWDLAGQPEYAAGLQPYIVPGSLYLLAVPAQIADDQNYPDVLGRWLDYLQAGAPEAVVDVEYMDDGRLIAAVHVGAQSVLRIHNADGSLAREIDPGALIISNVETEGSVIAVEASAPRHPTELFRLDGDVAFVTGAGSGFGRIAALSLARAGASRRAARGV